MGEMIISHSITIFSRDNIFQVQLIELVDLNELEDSYLQYLFYQQFFVLFIILYFFPLFSLSLSLSLYSGPDIGNFFDIFM